MGALQLGQKLESNGRSGGAPATDVGGGPAAVAVGPGSAKRGRSTTRWESATIVQPEIVFPAWADSPVCSVIR